jgi:hypothetical protein
MSDFVVHEEIQARPTVQGGFFSFECVIVKFLFDMLSDCHECHMPLEQE